MHTHPFCGVQITWLEGIPLSEQHPLMSAREVAEALRVCHQTVLRLAQAGTLPSLRLGRTYRFRRDQIEGLIEGKSAGVVKRSESGE
jgi:excisionase family DNA binding protein